MKRKERGEKLGVAYKLGLGLGMAASLAAIFSALPSGNSSAVSSNSTETVMVTVKSSCNIMADNLSKTKEFMPGTYSQIGGDTTLTISCNDPNGYSIYAVGASGDKDAEGNTNLVGKSSNIATGTATSGETSAWHMKLSEATSGLTIAAGFDANHVIPASRTNVANRTAGTTGTSGDSFKVSYSAYVSKMQAPDTYTGKVKYILFNPSGNPSKTMQTFSCADLQEGQMTTLIDSRDNNPYNVAKLKDGKCWMVDNLRLGLSGKTTKLTAADSDVSADYTLPASKASGFTGTDNEAVYVDGTYGGYYSWKAATAGTGTSAVASGNATSSICPKGWKLPTGGSSGDFNTLVKKYGSGTDEATSTALQMTPFPGFVLSGRYNSSSPNYQGSNGLYWSSTAYGSDFAYRLSLGSSGVYAANNDRKEGGYSVRCVAR